MPETVSTSPDANATALNIVDLSSVELEAAGCKWLCTGRSGCYWACGGGRRLSTFGAKAEAVHTPRQANETEVNIVDMPSVELEAAGCKWLCTGKSGCYWACGGGRRLHTSTDDVLEIVSTVADANATALYAQR